MDAEEFLEHFGVRGQKWGVRNSEKQQFKSDVKAAKKGQGVSKGITKPETKDGKLTGDVLGNFKNTKGEKVSKEYANKVMSKAVRQQDIKRMAGVGLLFATAFFGGKAIGKMK